MPGGGAVGVKVRPAAGSGVDVVVEDEGGGVDEETRERMFEPFFTTKGHGTGLGLAITRQIVEAHGGTIACDGRPQGGTRFWIHLPSRRNGERRSSSPRDRGAEGWYASDGGIFASRWPSSSPSF